MYKPLYKASQLILGNGDVVVVTGWKPKESVAKQIPVSWYAAIGQLYSPTRGINILVRNLLANPEIGTLLILSLTREDSNSGSCLALAEFFRHGFASDTSETGQPVWRIKSSVTAYIDREIPSEALERLRESIKSIFIETAEEYKGILSSIKDCSFSSVSHPNLITVPSRLNSSMRYQEPLIYPTRESTPEIMPGELYGHRISGKTIAETWVKILHRIKTTGVIRPTGYDGSWQELINVVAVVTDEPEEFYFPEPNYLPLDKQFLELYIPQILGDAPYQEGVKYTYGQRLRSWFGRDQISLVIRKLIKEVDSASAVMSLWDSGSGDIPRFGRRANASDHDYGGSPCLNHIWVRVVDGVLSLTATFRSNDMFAAWPANAMGLRALQRHIRDEIASKSDYNLTMGPLITISQSAHIYDDTWENVEYLLNTQYKKLCTKRDYQDKAGNFIVSFEDGQIIAEQTTPSGETIATYRGRNAQSVYHQIASAVPHIEVEHALYLGAELGKVEVAFFQQLKGQ
jgi:thymidylate synthase